MRILVLLLALASVAGVYLFGGNRLDEEKVRQFYQRNQDAFLALDEKALCQMLAEDYRQTVVQRVEGSQQRLELDKAGTCAAGADTLAMLRKLQQAMRGRSPIKYQQTLTAIDVAADGSTAAVEVRSTLSMPGIRMTSRSRDTVVRRRWRMLAASSDATVWMGPDYR
jgi:hypothetical protein